MGIRISLMALALVCLVASGCAKKQPQPEMNPEAVSEANPTVVKFEKFRQTYDAATADGGEFVFESDEIERAFKPAAAKAGTSTKAPKSDSGVTSIVLARAHKSIGTPYVFGGTQPGGFDCSGLVQWAYKGAGIRLPRTAREQSQSGFGIRDKSKMRAGDIVAFRRRGGYHTGIYIGDGKFIHAPRRNKRVRIESMDTGYFARNFIGARRVATSSRSTELAKATEKADRKYTASRKTRSKSGVASRKSVASKSAKAPGRKSAQATRASKGRTAQKAAARTKTTAKSRTAAAKKPAASGKTRSTAKKSAAASAKRQTAQAKKPAAKTSKASSGGKAAASKKPAQAAAKKSAAAPARKTQARADNRKIEVRPAKRTVNEARKARNKG